MRRISPPPKPFGESKNSGYSSSTLMRKLRRKNSSPNLLDNTGLSGSFASLSSLSLISLKPRGLYVMVVRILPQREHASSILIPFELMLVIISCLFSPRHLLHFLHLTMLIGCHPTEDIRASFL